MIKVCRDFIIYSLRNIQELLYSTSHIAINQIRSFSMDCWIAWIWGLIWEPSFETTEQAITGLETPHARPRASKNKQNKVRDGLDNLQQKFTKKLMILQLARINLEQRLHKLHKILQTVRNSLRLTTSKLTAQPRLQVQHEDHRVKFYSWLLCKCPH